MLPYIHNIHKRPSMRSGSLCRNLLKYGIMSLWIIKYSVGNSLLDHFKRWILMWQVFGKVLLVLLDTFLETASWLYWSWWFLVKLGILMKSKEWRGHFNGVSVKTMVVIKSTYENLQVSFFFLQLLARISLTA